MNFCRADEFSGGAFRGIRLVRWSSLDLDDLDDSTVHNSRDGFQKRMLFMMFCSAAEFSGGALPGMVEERELPLVLALVSGQRNAEF